MEPFDEQLASRVSALSDDVDEMTERVVAYRKRIPSAYAQAVQQRSEALSALIDAREERRQRKLRKSKPRARFPALMKGEPLCGTLSHSQQWTLRRKPGRKRCSVTCIPSSTSYVRYVPSTDPVPA